jgi:hypothetical protein
LGAIGVRPALGHWRTFTRAVVQTPGVALTMSASVLQRAVAQSERMRDVMLRYQDSLLVQMQQTAQPAI